MLTRWQRRALRILARKPVHEDLKHPIRVLAELADIGYAEYHPRYRMVFPGGERECRKVSITKSGETYLKDHPND